jgi:hypothetical protein
MNNFLDSLKGLGKLLGMILLGIGYIPFKLGNMLVEIRFSSEIEAEKAAKLKEQELLKPTEPAPLKKRAPRKKVEKVETLNNKEV